MAAPETVLKLCETFDAHKEHYKSSNYNETELRREFLDPLFKALGWDVDNEQGYADAYKDVIHEDAIKMGGYTKAPDYCFRIGGARKFFVEAKKPSTDIRGDTAPAYQLRRYGWSAKLPLSILSDFEELAVYDTRIRPNKGDKSAKARTLYYTYDQYAEKWDEIAAIFSREAVLKGSFDKYAETAKGKRGTGAVDETFLAEIERWRDALARNLALRNDKLAVRDLNYAVQKIIDRIIFLRICEDRGTEDYGRLQSLQNGNRTYVRLMQLFLQADDRYNSGLFHFDQGEKGRPSTPDTLTPGLAVDDAVLKDIFKNLYYPDSPFEFSVLPADILGQVYEQFLGKTIRLTASHQAKIEEKPEVRKAGGVYYTPGYIVDYIVKNTLGRLLDGEDPDQPKPIHVNKAAEIKVLDPACGSGSFLIVAYQYLLDWHLRQYTADPVTGERDETRIKKHASGKSPKLYQGAGDVWRLTTSERKRILLNNIHGVDIDSQAVEVTKLSLLLKVLENETKQHLQRDFIAERQRILPDLGNNIQCGNSLIGPDFYDNEQMLLLDEEIQYRINVFDWNTGFPDIMERGGFDCVIGNPPYVFTRDGGFTEMEKAYYYAKFSHQSSQLNTFGLFLERGLGLIQADRYLSYIIPNNWLTIDSFAPLRKHILESTGNIAIVNIMDRVFGANVDTAIIRMQRTNPTYVQIAEMREHQIWDETIRHPTEFAPPPYIFSVARTGHKDRQPLLSKLQKQSVSLFEVATVSTGLKVYQRGKGKPVQSDAEKKTRVYHSKSKDTHEHERYLEGADVCRYYLGWSGSYLRYGDWLAEPRRSVPFKGERILVRQIPSKPPYCLHAVATDTVCYNDINSMVIFDPIMDIRFILGLLNSRLTSFWFIEKYQKLQRKIFPQFKVKELKAFPIRRIGFDNPADVAMHDKMVMLVDRMLDLNKKKAAEKNPNILKQLETQITTTDRQIDRLVYELYGLTEEEVAIVEGAERKSPRNAVDAATVGYAKSEEREPKKKPRRRKKAALPEMLEGWD